MIHFNSSKILIPVDFSETSLLAIKHGAFIAQLTKGDLYLLHVVNTHYASQNMFLPIVTLDMGEIETKASEKLAQLASDVSKEYGVNAQIIIKTGSPSTEVTNVAKEIKAGLIVMGTHGYSPVEELVIGSVALKVITKSSCPTMAMNSDAEHKGYHKIVMPIDMGVNSRQKVNFTIELAKKFGAVIHAIGLLGTDESSDQAEMETILKQVKELAAETSVIVHTEVLKNLKNRATGTVNYIDSIGADLAVIMTDQDAELSGFFLGPFSQQIIHNSKVPVIAIKPANIFSAEDTTYLPGTSGS